MTNWKSMFFRLVELARADNLIKDEWTGASDPDPENWRTMNGQHIHLSNGRIDGGVGGKMQGKYFNGKKPHKDDDRPAQGNLFTGEYRPIVGKSEIEAAKQEKQAKAEAAEKRKEEQAEKAAAREAEKERQREERENRRYEASKQREKEKQRQKQEREGQKIDRLRAKEAAGTLTPKEKEWLEQNDIPMF